MSPDAKTELRNGTEASGRPRFAVVLKTYVWDDFVERQALRCQASTVGGDFFLSIDETNGPVGPVPFANVRRTSNAAMLALGLADRFHEGSLLWWNADYPHVDFFQTYPDYDFYVFLEYDALYLGDLGALVSRLAEQKADFAAITPSEAKEAWYWTHFHLATYSLEELEACLICICVCSRRAMAHLAQRRLHMSQDRELPFWPLAEAFLPTEIRRAGMRFVPLESLGDVSAFNWYPPQWEEDVLGREQPAFAHPVYDTKRYVRWALKQGSTPSTYLRPSGPVLSALSILPARLYMLRLLVRLLGSVQTSVLLRTRTRAETLKARRMEPT